jgi:hypothetical protein
MNRVSIYGGLGNQMFQYALCLALNHKGNKSRILISNFLYYDHHGGFNLSKAFKIRLPFQLNLLNYFLLHFKFIYKNRIAASLFRQLIKGYQKWKYNVYLEKEEFEYDSHVFDQKSKLFIGVWQSIEYFTDIKDLLFQEFVFKIPKDEKNREIIDKIINSNSVSVHIRRGDYLNSEWGKLLTVINGTTYFRNSIDYIEKKITKPHYFIFSDDIQWAKDNLKLAGCTYVDHNKGEASYIDMYLMSLCKHNIIANSTFSWWGAWLNKNRDKIVIMPDKWINRDIKQGIFPNNWIKLSVNL